MIKILPLDFLGDDNDDDDNDDDTQSGKGSKASK